MRIAVICFLLIGGSMLTGCSEEKSTDSEEKLVERVRPTSARGTSAAYFLYENTLSVTDTLIALRSDVAEVSQVHESYETEDGMMGMREQKELVVAPREILRFKQGGLHVMLIGVQKDLQEGDSVLVELEWAQAGLVQKKLPVRTY